MAGPGRGRKGDSVGGLLARCQRLADQHFPTESLYNLLRPLGVPTGHQLHDMYNLAALPVLCAFCFRFLRTGESFEAFVLVAYGYFFGDLAWVLLNPSCVKSPGVIAGHHVLTMLYMLYPCLYPQLRHYMAMCLTVELNTFFLILRRVWHVPPVSVAFYLSWVGIRLLVYPYLLGVFALLYAQRVRSTARRGPPQRPPARPPATGHRPRATRHPPPAAPARASVSLRSSGAGSTRLR